MGGGDWRGIERAPRGSTLEVRDRDARHERERVLRALALARRVVPRYGRGTPATTREVSRLARYCSLQVDRAVLDMDAPAVLLPPLGGRRRLILAPQLGPALRRYVTLHEIGHVLAGDADEITLLRFRGPLPEAEDVADLFALCGVLAAADLLDGPAGIEARIRVKVPLDDRGWRVHRVPRLARKLWKARRKLMEGRGAR